MIKPVRSFVGAVLLGLAGLMSTPLASAAIVTGSWDPALPNPPFDNLGWTTTVNVSVAKECIRDDQSTDGRVRNYALFGYNFKCDDRLPRGDLPFDILSAEIGIYDLSSMRIIDVLRFDPNSFVPFSLELGTGGAIEFLFSLTDSNAVRGSDDVARTRDFFFKLDLPGAAPAIKFKQVGASGGYTTGTEVPIQTAFAINPDSALQDVLTATRLDRGQPVFTAQVPEPGSLALVLLALGVAGGVARRRVGQSN